MAKLLENSDLSVTLLLSIFGFFVLSFFIPLEEPPPVEVLPPMQHELLVNCKDGTCYDPKTNKVLGEDKIHYVVREKHRDYFLIDHPVKTK